MQKKRLTARQKKFVALFEGNATQAAILAGYSNKTAYSIGQENLKKPEIIEAIKEREKKEIDPLIANRKQRQQFWSHVMNDEAQDMHNRLKASELLGKSEADFTDKLSIPVFDNLAELLKEARERVARVPMVITPGSFPHP